MAVGKLTTIENLFQMYSQLSSSVLTHDLFAASCFSKVKQIDYQPSWEQVVLLAVPNCDPYGNQVPSFWLICLLMSTRHISIM
jgi:hypothetical protein